MAAAESTTLTSLEAEIDHLATVLNSAGSDDAEFDDETIAQTVKLLLAAEDVAGNVEERLDEIIGNLDKILETSDKENQSSTEST